MPLIKSSSDKARSENIAEMIRSGYTAKQAEAAAYDNQRRNRAFGGANYTPWYIRSKARNIGHVGPLHSIVGGRTDHIPLDVPVGSYVVPADIVSGLGQGNTQNGLAVLSRMFHSGPYGMPLRANGGNVKGSVPIMAAGGEFVVPPDAVSRVGGGDLDRGHKILDKWVVETRKKHVKTLRNLPGPER